MSEKIELNNIPQELKNSALWCCWKLTSKGKIPFNAVTDGFAKSNDKTTFCDFNTLLVNMYKYLQYDDNGKQIGGIGLGIFNGFSAIDIDNCIDDNGEFSQLAKDIIEYCKSYTEISPSKHGIRIIFKTDDRIDKSVYYINNSRIGLEIYISDNTNKFVTITGNALNDKSIEHISIMPLLDRYMRKEDAFLNALKSDRKLIELYNSVASGSHGNESETDLALCNKLAFYLNCDPVRINNEFINSPYFKSKDKEHKKKWCERDDYRQHTIEMAINGVSASIVDYNVTHSNNMLVSNKYALNDTGNAQHFYDMFGDGVHYNVENKKWMIWNGKYWQVDVYGKIKQFVEILAEKKKQDAFNENDLDKQANILKNVNKIFNHSGKDNLLLEAQHIGNIPALNSDFDKDAMVLCCENGVVDLKNGTLRPHSKNDMISMSTHHEIDLEHEPKRWIKFLNDVFENDKEIVNYVHKILGYAITNETKEQCMFVFYGDGRNGKSLLLDVVREALGDYSITTRPQLLTEQRNGNSNMDEVARLKGKRYIISEESKIGDKLDESLIKTLTSGIGNIVAKFLYGDSFEFAVTGKIFMATNHRPVIRGNDNGIWRRINVIPFNKMFKDKDDDKDLIFKLKSEIPQILGWLVRGCMLWQKEGIEPPKKVLDSTTEYRVEMDIIQRWIDDRCELDSSYYARSSELFTDFNSYCMRDKEFQMSNTLFGRNMVKKFTRKRLGSGYVYYGIRLKQGNENLALRVAYDRAKVDEDI